MTIKLREEDILYFSFLMHSTTLLASDKIQKACKIVDRLLLVEVETTYRIITYPKYLKIVTFVLGDS